MWFRCSDDQVHEILKSRGRIHTQLKIDEISNLGAAKIRVRSLKAALEEKGPIEEIPEKEELYGERIVLHQGA